MGREKRRKLRPDEALEIWLRQGGSCALCDWRLIFGAYEDDHRIALACGGSDYIDNHQFLCAPCHAKKTKFDTRLAAKIKRQRGETGQRARRKKRAKPKFRRKLNGTVVKKE